MSNKVFLLDTNVLLHDPQCIFNFKNNIVCIAIETLEELDKFKSQLSSRGYNARQTHKVLSSLLVNNHSKHEGNFLSNSIGKSSQGEIRIILNEYNSVTSPHLEFVSRYFPDVSKVDNKLLACAKYLQHKYNDHSIFLISKDVNLLLKAKSLKIQAQDYLTDKIKNQNDIYKKINIQDNQIESLINNLPAPYTTKELYSNEYIQIPYENDFLYARYLNNQLIPLNPVALNGFKIGPNGKYIKPQNKEQSVFLDSLLNDDIQLVTCRGNAGSGKTFLALAAAAHLLLNKTPSFQKIHISRILTALEDIGFLPGDMSEKSHPFMQGYFDNLSLLFPSSPQTPNIPGWNFLFNKAQLNIEVLSYIRGRSIPNSFIIIDESQNLTPHQAKTIVTRLSKGSKIVLLGDTSQIDSPFLDEFSNGLTYVRERMKNEILTSHPKLIQTVRSDLASLATQLL